MTTTIIITLIIEVMLFDLLFMKDVCICKYTPATLKKELLCQKLYDIGFRPSTFTPYLI